jgi:hypothetical protein
MLVVLGMLISKGIYMEWHQQHVHSSLLHYEADSHGLQED